MSNYDMLIGFWKTFLPRIESPGGKSEKLVRVGDATKALTLNVDVSSDPKGKGSIHNIYLPEFAREALVEIQKHRIISHPRDDGIYKVIEKLSGEPGTYAMAYDNEPIFNIKIKISSSDWAVRPMTIQDYEEIGQFTYVPDADGEPKNILIRTSVPKKIRNDEEKWHKNIFLEFHKKVRERCIEIGMTPIGEKKSDKIEFDSDLIVEN